MLPTNNSDIYRVATAYAAAKDAQTVAPDQADLTRELGRMRFYDALAGRYGLPGSIYTDAIAASETDAGGDSGAASGDATGYDLSNMTVDQVLHLADSLRASGKLDQQSADLMGYRLDALPFSMEQVFTSSPVADFARSLGQGQSGAGARTLDLIRQQEDQLRYLTENNADPRAIRGAQSVLGQLRQLQVEQALYAQIDAGRKGGDRDSGGFGPFGATTDMMSLPPSAIAMFSQFS